MDIQKMNQDVDAVNVQIERGDIKGALTAVAQIIRQNLVDAEVDVNYLNKESEEHENRLEKLEAPPTEGDVPEESTIPVATAEELDDLAVRVKTLEDNANSRSTVDEKPKLIIAKDDGSAIKDEQLCNCGKIITLKTIKGATGSMTRWFHRPGEACAKVFAELHPK